MTIEVTGCHDCPFRECGNWCARIESNTTDFVYDKEFHPSCPLQTESITIKKKDDDNTGIHKE